MYKPKFNWIPSIEVKNEIFLNELEHKMVDFYSHRTPDLTYYEVTDYFWKREDFLAHQDIINSLSTYDKIIEIGCGTANILKLNRLKQEHYTGTEFSRDIIEQNKKAFPKASFFEIDSAYNFDFPSNTFDVVFSHFVIEHTVRPARFIDECLRILKPNGMFVLICPGFVDFNILSSQRLGFSNGTFKEKIVKRKFIDAFLTLYDSRVRLPLFCKRLKRDNYIKANFFVNLDPTCFYDDFRPDLDAVYAVDQDEIEQYLATKADVIKVDAAIAQACLKHKHVYVKAIKKEK